MVKDTPESDPHISSEELKFLKEHIGPTNAKVMFLRFAYNENWSSYNTCFNFIKSLNSEEEVKR